MVERKIVPLFAKHLGGVLGILLIELTRRPVIYLPLTSRPSVDSIAAAAGGTTVLPLSPGVEEPLGVHVVAPP